jgi:hypothetical protein
MALKDFLEEAAIMKEMKHPNLVQLLGMCFIHKLSARFCGTERDVWLSSSLSPYLAFN